MDKQLASLISRYQASVRTALVLMQRSGIQMPYSSANWFEFDIAGRGELEGGVHYYKHGFGCEVSLPTGAVDFDFGKQGEIGGFDLWRLQLFAGNRLSEYGFETKDEIKQSFNAAVSAGAVICSEHGLYYIADAPRLLAIDIENRSSDDKLPSRNQDPVLVLYAHYFLVAQLMQKNYKTLDEKWKKRGDLSQNDRINLKIYLSTWLGFLAVTCEGFKKLRIRILIQENRPDRFREILPQCDAIGKLMKQHSDSLREFRNKTFHLRDDVEAILQFFDRDADRLTWAADLHAGINRFFSEYRICCEVHYAIHNRKSEMDSWQKPKRRKLNIS